MRKRILFWSPLALLVLLYFFGGQLGFFPGKSLSPSKNEIASTSPPAQVSDGKPDAHSPTDELPRQKEAQRSTFESFNGDEITASTTDATNRSTRDESDLVAQPLHILIDGHKFFIASGARKDATASDWQPISLADIVERASRTSADATGMRVRISRRGSSRVSAEQELIDALRQADMTEDEILLEKTLLP